MMEQINEQQVRLWWSVFKGDGVLTEVRIIDGKRNFSGYFDDIEVLIPELRKYYEYNCFFSINELDPSCSGREQYNHIIPNPKATTSDKDIISRKFVFIDVDVRKATGSNSTDEEFAYAKKTSNKIYKFLKDNGFSNVICGTSGNGCHIYIPCYLKASKENDDIIQKFTKAMSMLFSDDTVEVDKNIFNRARIAKIFGTYSRKGSPTNTERPQRMAELLRYPEKITPNDIEYFKKIANLYPEPERPSRSNNFSNERFDLDFFLEKYNISVTDIENVDGGKKYVLDHCVFDENHKGKDAVIFQADNGALSYYCFHNSCSQYTWKDVRLKYEPDAYSRNDYNEFQRKQPYYGSPYQYKEVFKPKEESEELGKKWLSMSDIKYVDVSKLPTIPTGFYAFDRAVGGLILGEMTVMSGSNASGKSSWLNCLALNAIEKGWKTAIWSGELVNYRLKGWLNQAAAGKSYVNKKDGYDNLYYVNKNISEKIDMWENEKLFIYNNEYGNRWEQLCSDIVSLIEEKEIKLVILDNLMAANLEGLEGDSNAKQKNFILQISSMAKKYGVHIIVVAHPRKETSFLRKESISGSGDIVNITDNLILIHRVNLDFQTRGREFFGDKVDSYMGFGNVIEISKSRSTGVCDYLIGLYYEIETRRFKNSVSEHVNYGWMEYSPQMKIEDMDYNNNEFTSYSEITDEDFTPTEECPF